MAFFSVPFIAIRLTTPAVLFFDFELYAQSSNIMRLSTDFFLASTGYRRFFNHVVVPVSDVLSGWTQSVVLPRPDLPPDLCLQLQY
jgi:hypothetical protein